MIVIHHNVSQFGTITKHIVYSGCNFLFSNIETGEINLYQIRAQFKHGLHVRHITNVKMGKVKRCQTATTVEHIVHVGNFGSIQIFESFYCRKSGQAVEPVGATCRACICKAAVEHDLDDLQCPGIVCIVIIQPLGYTFIKRRHAVEVRLRGGGHTLHVLVIAERQCLCISLVFHPRLLVGMGKQGYKKQHRKNGRLHKSIQFVVHKLSVFDYYSNH